MKTNKLKKSLFINIAFLTLVVLLTTSFSYKKTMLAYSSCVWYANNGAILSATLDDDGAQYNSQSNITTSWSTFIYYVNPTINIQTILGSNHPAGTVTIYRTGAPVKIHTVAANTSASFFDSFEYTGNSTSQFEVVWGN